MQPVYNYSTNTGIPIYTVRGNHENMCSEGAPIPELKQAYYDAFHTYLPTNGPFNSTTDNQVGFSYSLIKNNVTFVAADQYFYYDEAAADPYHALDQKYVSDQLTSSNTTFKILMAHVPVFQTEGGGESEHFFGDNTSGNQTRSDFWNMMSEDGVQLYLCGHIHNESVATTPVTDGGTILQLMAGNGGAPPDVVENLPEPGVDVLHTSGQFGFSLATVGTDSMTIQYYSLDTADNSWSIADYATVIVPEPSSACLLALGMMVLVFLCLRHHDPANRRRRYSITFMALSPLAGRLSGCPPARIRHFATKPAWKLCLQLELTGNRPRHPKSDFYQQIFDFLCTGCAASLGQREVTAGDRPAAMRTRRGAERRLR